jgi:hypothetical protein
MDHSRMLFAALLKHLFCGVLVVLSLLSGSTRVRAADATPLTGGTITIDLVGDGDAVNNCMTLREAILIANGGTGMNGLNHKLGICEHADVTGCDFVEGPVGE